MRLSLILSLLIAVGSKAQNPADIVRIDSIVKIIAEKASNKQDTVIEGVNPIDQNLSYNVRFHLKGDSTNLIIIESELKEWLKLFFFSESKLIYVAYMNNGNYNEIDRSYYFVGRERYEKREEKFIPFESDIFHTMVKSIFDMYKSQLKLIPDSIE